MAPAQKCFLLLSVTLALLDLPGVTAELVFHVHEELEEGTFIGNVRDAVVSPMVARFKLLAHTLYFDLDAQTGDLHTTSTKLDREQVCPYERDDRCSMTLDIFTSSQEYGEFSKVKLFILDVNDNSPEFSEETYTISLPEDTPVGTKLHVDHLAKDPDILDNGAVRYVLVSELFSLDYRSEMISLVLRKSLDRESQSEHRMTLVAVDGGKPPLSGTTTFLIKVTDVNDNCPMFVTSEVSVELPRDTSVGSTITQLTAEDKDLGENSVIRYHYGYRVPEAVRDLFPLDSADGTISLAGPLPRDTTQYKLSVLAFGFGCAPAMATVTLQLEEKIQQPKMEFRFLGAQHQDGVSIKEDAVPGSVIAILEVTDPDQIIQRPLSINGPSPFLLKPSESSPDTYLLLTSTHVDFESENHYDISIVGRSTLDESVTFTEHLTVLIEDVNDNAPRFPQNLLEVSIEENNPPGETLLRVSASDHDSGPNGELRYYLEDEDPHVFSVNASSGVLTVWGSLDRERKSSYSLRVVAEDLGVPPRNDSCLILVDIRDHNDNPPVFSSEEFMFYIPENLPRGGNVGIINVTDADVGPNGDFSVSLLEETPLFSVQDSILRSQASLDYEKDRMYELWLEARDKGSPSLASRARVLVFLLDVNDNAPLIVLPESNFSYVLVPPDTSKGSPVAKVHAVDYDAGRNGAITYSQLGGMNPSVDLFQVDSHSGNITLKEDIGDNQCGLYQLLVKASDQGFPQALFTIVRVNILLNQSISNHTHLQSLIMTHREVLLLSPCPQDPQTMAMTSWSLSVPVALAVASVSVICCTLGTFLFLYSRRRSSRKRPSPDVGVPLRIKEEECAKDWDEVKCCKSSEAPLSHH